jgi:hypothetical protein
VTHHDTCPYLKRPLLPYLLAEHSKDRCICHLKYGEFESHYASGLGGSGKVAEERVAYEIEEGEGTEQYVYEVRSGDSSAVSMRASMNMGVAAGASGKARQMVGSEGHAKV